MKSVPKQDMYLFLMKKARALAIMPGFTPARKYPNSLRLFVLMFVFICLH